MVSYRTRGIFTLSLLIQAAAVCAVFWIWLPLSHRKLNYENLYPGHYAIYLAMLILGLAISAKPGALMKSDLWNASRNALRQCVYAFGFLFIFVIGAQDRFISRFFLFSLMPLVYVTLAICARYVPPA